MKSQTLHLNTVPEANPAGAQRPQRLQLVYHTLKPIEVDEMPVSHWFPPVMMLP